MVGFDALLVGGIFQGTGNTGTLVENSAATVSNNIATAAAAAGSSLAVIQATAVANPNGYDLNRAGVGTGVTAYNFYSGPAVAVLNPTSPLSQPGYLLPNGIAPDQYFTATNILSATDSSGGTFLNRIAATTGNDYATTVVPIFEATKAATANAVAAGTPTADMLSFWEVGLANGSFPNTTDGIQTAVANYAAAITLSVIESAGSGNGAWDHLATNGVRSIPAS